MIASDAMDYATAPPRRRRGNFERRLFMPAFVFVVVVSFVPFVYAMVQSLHRSDFLDLGRFVGFGNYVEFLTDRPGIGLEVNDEVARRYVRPGTEYFGERP